MKRLPVDPDRGYPVPWFVQWFDAVTGKPGEFGIGRPDFRVADTRKMTRAVRERRCWVCGEELGIYLAFVIGPMCAINRITSEPPTHRECAIFSATACPFLTMPKMIRRPDETLPPGVKDPAGMHIERNPGVALVWIARSYRLQRVQQDGKVHGGILFELGDPLEVLWFCDGRKATRTEILHSIDTGFPTLHEAAMIDGPDAVHDVEERYKLVLRKLVPAG